MDEIMQNLHLLKLLGIEEWWNTFKAMAQLEITRLWGVMDASNLYLK